MGVHACDARSNTIFRSRNNIIKIIFQPSMHPHNIGFLCMSFFSLGQSLFIL